jgi:hypothetical protein
VTVTVTAARTVGLQLWCGRRSVGLCAGGISLADQDFRKRRFANHRRRRDQMPMKDSVSTVRDILIVIDPNLTLENGALPPSAATMFADPTIVKRNQGTNELWVQVNQGDYLRWRAVCKPYKNTQTVQTIIQTVTLWPAAGSNQLNIPQLDAVQFLPTWEADSEQISGHVFAPSDQVLSFTQANSQSFKIGTGDRYAQYVQAHCHGYTNTAADIETSPKCVAYSFTCLVYRGDENPVPCSWDPFVTILQNNSLGYKK